MEASWQLSVPEKERVGGMRHQLTQFMSLTHAEQHCLIPKTGVCVHVCVHMCTCTNPGREKYVVFKNKDSVSVLRSLHSN